MQPAALRGHFERRSPLGTHRLLTYVAYLAAHHWELAENLRATVTQLPAAERAKVMPSLDALQAAIALQAAFVDQAAMDGGKYNLSWLLVGLPQPPFATIRLHVERQGKEPFSPLVDPRWIAANLAYLRDLDYVTQRQATLGGPPRPAAPPNAGLAVPPNVTAVEEFSRRRRPKAKAKAGAQPPDGGAP